MTGLAAFWLAAASAWGVPGQEPGLIEESEIKLTVCPVTVELERDGRIRSVRFAFVPFGLRNPCQGKFIKECRDLARDKGMPAYARRSKEPEQVLDFKVGRDKPELLAKLAVVPAVKALRERVDVTWTPGGEGKEYPLDKKRVLVAKLRWRTFVNADLLDFIDLAK
ncbi:MAG: hypothetical protein HY925_00585 [Elusimicrobia bacterium]|nr:hypothetical protein [Elusimicrobiota bacterium]